MLTIVGSRDQFRTPRNFVPKGHFLVGDVPQPDFSIERAGDEKLVILGVESKGGDAVDVLENTEAVFSGDVPEADSLVHRACEYEVVLGPGDVQQIGRVTGVGDKRTVHEDVPHGVWALEVFFPCSILKQLLIGDNLVLLLVFPPHIVEELKLVSQNPNAQEPILTCCCQQPT